MIRKPMSLLFHPLRRKATFSITMAVIVFTQSAPDASAADYTWTQTAGGAQNWTTGGNWLGGSPPSPVSGDTVDFSTVDILANTTLTLGATRTATSWKFGDTSGGQTWTVTGNTLTLGGTNAQLQIGTATTISSVLAVANNTTATATGSGSLTLNTSNFSLGGTASGATQTLNLSSLSNFTYNNSSGTFSVAGTNNTGGTNWASGSLRLATTSTITAAAFDVGNVNNGGLNDGVMSTNSVHLGATATINANAITVGGNRKAQGTVGYAVGSGITNAAVTLRGSDGSSRVTSMTIGSSLITDSYAANSSWNMVNNIAGTSTLDAMIGSLTIGEATRTVTGATSATVTGTFLMGAGTLDATTMVLGKTNTGNMNAAGTFTTATGGTVKVGTLTLGDKNYTANGNTVTGTFNLNGGANLYATTIQRGANTSFGSAVRSFNWNDGTIHNLAGTDLTIGTIGESAPVTWTLAATGTRTFDIDNGRTGNVNVVLGGTNGTLTKTGLGLLKLNAANTYTGTTTVNQGTMELGAADRIHNSSALAVTGGTFDLGGFTETVAAVSMSSGSISNGTLTGSSYSFTNSGSVSANLAGSGVNLTKSGAGIVTISSTDNSYSGTTTVTGGTLVIDGNISTSSLTTIGNGTDAATLKGIGTVGALTIAANAFHNPGNSPGIMNTGDYTMNGTLTTEINGTTPGITGHDQVNVTGTVSLSGNLVATFGGGSYVNGSLIFILLNDGGDSISGTFAGLAQGATVTTYGGFDWIISYTGNSGGSPAFTGGNDVVLMAQTAIPEPTAAILGSIGMVLLLRRRRIA